MKLKYRIQRSIGNIYKKIFGYKFINFSSLKEYHDWYNSKKFEFYCKIGLFNGHYDSPIQTSLKLTSPDMFDWNEIEKENGPKLKYICQECYPHFDELCIFDPHQSKEKIFIAGRFIGIEITHEDYYYMMQYNDQIKYSSCVGRILFINEDESTEKQIDTELGSLTIFEYQGINYVK